MNAKVFVVFLVLSLIEGNRGETLNEALVDLKSQIASAKSNIDLIIQNSAISIGETRSTISQTISQAETKVQEHLDQLNNAIQEAKQQGKDGTKCISDAETAISGLDTNKLNQCAQNQDLNLVGIQLANLRSVKRDLSRSIGLCSRQLDVAALRSCVENDIKTAGVKVQDIESRLQNVFNQAPKDAALCVEGVLKDLNTFIDNVERNLKNCL